MLIQFLMKNQNLSLKLQIIYVGFDLSHKINSYLMELIITEF